MVKACICYFALNAGIQDKLLQLPKIQRTRLSSERNHLVLPERTPYSSTISQPWATMFTRTSAMVSS